jgi:hypothetical protein
MAPLGENLSDEEIAAVLTWIRQSWGNFASPVTVEQIARARDITPRDGLWQVRAIESTYPLYRDRIRLSTVAAEATAGLPARTFATAVAIFAVPAIVLLIVLAFIFRAAREA